MRVAMAVLAGLSLAVLFAAFLWQQTRSRVDTRPVGTDAVPSPAVTPTDNPLPVPLSERERERAEYEHARAPFMHALESFAAQHGCKVAVSDDLSELAITASVWPQETMETMRDEAIRLGAADQGFAVIRFYAAMPDGSGLPPRLIAEVAYRDGRWTTFLR